MPPKKSTGKHPHKIAETSSIERRSKYREDVSNRAEQTIEEPTLSPFSTRQIISMAMRPVTSGRSIIFSFLTELGLQIGDKIKEQGWSYFCSLNVLTYPNLVRSFYEYLIMGEEHIASTVKGKRIIITEESLGSLLQMPTEGNRCLKLDCRTNFA